MTYAKNARRRTLLGFVVTSSATLDGGGGTDAFLCEKRVSTGTHEDGSHISIDTVTDLAGTALVVAAFRRAAPGRHGSQGQVGVGSVGGTMCGGRITERRERSAEGVSWDRAGRKMGSCYYTFARYLCRRPPGEKYGASRIHCGRERRCRMLPRDTPRWLSCEAARIHRDARPHVLARLEWLLPTDLSASHVSPASTSTP